MMPSPKDVIYPDGNDCSKCVYCKAVKLGKVQCTHYQEEIEPDLTGIPCWPADECLFYKPREGF